MDKDQTCCFTGHRPEKLPWKCNESDPRCIALKEEIAKLLERVYHEKGMRRFLCGMARGADMYFCDAVLALRTRYPDVELEAVIPCEEQAAHWSEAERNRYFSLVQACDYETMIQRRYDKDCMLRRNRYMIRRSSMLIAVYDGMLGGTMYTITQAKKQNLEVVVLGIQKENALTPDEDETPTAGGGCG
ncbi:MAG: DUF1273 domain-containing protein [Oscillospiraceae bacterium]|nr:DUF1273 domain-containing protein [Oscillospiraceae bacterium]